MAVITDIAPQKRNSNIFSIFVDNKFSFSLSDLDLSTSHLRIGQTLSKSDLNNLINKSQISKAYNKALNYISFRMRSEWEVSNYLKQKEFNDDVISNVILQLKNNKIIDDLDFSNRWLNDRNAFKPKSKKALKTELIKKRIPKEIIDQALLEFSEDKEIENLVTLISKKQKIPRYKDDKKLTEYMLRQGFSYNQIKLAKELAINKH